MSVKKINIVTSLCGAGLEREAKLLRELLTPQGIATNFIHYCGGPNENMAEADLTISLEVICPQALYLSPIHFYAPNSEMYPSIYDQYLPRINKFLCKTNDCFRIWANKVGADRCVYTSFEARDIYRPEIPREDIFLHVAGKSVYKGTESVIKAWQLHPGTLPPLTVVSDRPEYKALVDQNPSGITYFSYLKDEELIQLMNRARFHILPSQYEGFGHGLWEAFGCGGLVFTTNAPPMNEYPGVFTSLPVSCQTSQRLAKLSSVAPQSIYDAVQVLGGTLYTLFEKKSAQARESFLANQKFFRETIMGLINAI